MTCPGCLRATAVLPALSGCNDTCECCEASEGERERRLTSSGLFDGELSTSPLKAHVNESVEVGSHLWSDSFVV